MSHCAPRSVACRVLSLALGAVLGALSVPSPALDVPSWQVGDRWRVRRQMEIVLDDVGGFSVDLTIIETYDLAIASVGLAGDPPTLAYHLTRGNPSISGGGTAVIPDVGPLMLSFGAASTTTGYEDIRLGDLALIEESFDTSLVVRATIVVPLTIANARLAMTTTPGAPVDQFDFPLEAGNAWTHTSRQRLVGELTIDFVGLLEDVMDVDFPFDAEVDAAATWTAEKVTPTTIRVVDAVAATESLFDATFERFAARSVPGLEGVGLGAIAETVLSATLVPRPAFDFTLAPSAGAGGTSFLLAGTGAAAGETLEVFLPEFSTTPTEVVAENDGTFGATVFVPKGDDSTPSNDDLGSFGVVVRDEASRLRTRILRRLGEPGPAPAGAIVR